MTTQITIPLPTATARRTLRILYADDVRQLRDLLQIVLSQEGHTVDCVADGRLALEKITAATAKFDVVITDHHMPNMDGLSLVTQLRALAYPGKIIVFSSELSPAVTAAYRNLQVDYLLPKPIFPVTLRAVIATLFEA